MYSALQIGCYVELTRRKTIFTLEKFTVDPKYHI